MHSRDILKYLFIAIAFNNLCVQLAITQQTRCNYNFTGPSDIVFIMDRSGSQRSGDLSTNFEKMKNFILEFIHYFLIIRPGHNRIAVVSYGANVTTDFDFVSHPVDISECELFARGGIWERYVYFDPENANAPVIRQLFKEAFQRAMQILRHSDRRSQNIQKHIWILSDLQEDTELPLSDRDYELANLGNLNLFGYGIGHELFMEHFYDFIPDRCNSKTHTAWSDVINNADNFGMKTREGYVELQDRELCPSDCQRHGCSCLEFTHSHSNHNFRCNEAPERQSSSSQSDENTSNTDEDTSTWTIVGVAGGVILVAIAVIVFACTVRRGPKLNRHRAEPTRSISGMPETSTFTVEVPTVPLPLNSPDLIPEYRATLDNVYTNEDLELALRAHGLTTRRSDKQGASIPDKPPRQKKYLNNGDKLSTMDEENRSQDKQIRGVNNIDETNKFSTNQNRDMDTLDNPSRFPPKPVEKSIDEGGKSTNRNVNTLLAPTFKIRPMPGSTVNSTTHVGTGNEYAYTYMDMTSPKPNNGGNIDVRIDTKNPHCYEGHINHNTINAPTYTQRTLPLRNQKGNTTELASKMSTHHDSRTPEAISKLKKKLKPGQSNGMKTIKNPLLEMSITPKEKQAQSQKNLDEKHQGQMKLGTVKFNAMKAHLEKFEKCPVGNQSQPKTPQFSHLL